MLTLCILRWIKMSVRFAAIICLSIISPFANGKYHGDGVFMDGMGRYLWKTIAGSVTSLI